MKGFFVVVGCLLLFQISLRAAPVPGPVDVQHYTFSISLNDLSNNISCDAEVKLKKSRGLRNIALDLVCKGQNGKGMTVTAVKYASGEGSFKYNQESDKLNILLSGRSVDDTTVDILISYNGVPADGLIISQNKFGQRTFFSDNWPNRGHNWLVCHDHPSDKASVDFIVTAPVRYQIVSNGSLMEETNGDGNTKITHWSESKDLPVKAMCIGVAEFAVKYAGTESGVPIWTWVYTGNREKGFNDYAAALNILPFFTAHLGAFPYPKLANVQSTTIFGGMENAGAIFYSENSVTGEGKTNQVMAHEIAHQWFGDMATEADWPHLWLSEGFATCLSWMYMEDTYGQDTLNALLRKARNKVIDFYGKKQMAIVDTSVKKYMELLNPNTYEKAGWVLLTIRRQIGDSLFWKTLNAYYQKYSGKNATTKDFENVLDSVTKKNWSVYFNQWLFSSGHPVLSKAFAYDSVKKTLAVTIKQEQSKLFEFPLVVQAVGDEIVRKSLRVSQRETKFIIPMEAAPRQVLLDPQCRLLFEER